MEITMGIQKTLLVCVILMVMGDRLIYRFPILKKYCIPSAVVGGLLFAILNLILSVTGIAQFTFDDSMQKFFMYVFFTTAGFQANFSLLKKGGKKILLFFVLAIVLAFLQNAVAVALSFPLKVDPMTALMTGSTPMMGGHGNAGSFGKIAVDMGYPNSLNVAIAAATFGLVAGSIIGGPLADGIIRKKKLWSPSMNIDYKPIETEEEIEYEDDESQLSVFTYATVLVFMGLGIGAYFKDFFDAVLPSNINIPIHVMGMIGGCILTNILPKISKKRVPVPNTEIDLMGDISLSLFVTMAVMSMKLWDLATLAGPLVILLIAQVVIIVLFVRFITFPVMGSDYDSAVMCAGNIGFGMGAVPVSMADMKVVCDKYSYSRLAFFIVPIIGGMFSNFTNALIITGFMGFVDKL